MKRACCGNLAYLVSGRIRTTTATTNIHNDDNLKLDTKRIRFYTLTVTDLYLDKYVRLSVVIFVSVALGQRNRTIGKVTLLLQMNT